MSLLKLQIVKENLQKIIRNQDEAPDRDRININAVEDHYEHENNSETGYGNAICNLHSEECYFLSVLVKLWGAYWLRHYATYQQVAGSIPDGVI
jgi:hypothetical protein